jgi:hypothetical protein
MATPASNVTLLAKVTTTCNGQPGKNQLWTIYGVAQRNTDQRCRRTQLTCDPSSISTRDDPTWTSDVAMREHTPNA